MSERRLDATSLVAGLVLVSLGTILLLDRLDVLDLRFGYFWPALLGAVGAILVAVGLGHRRPD